MHGLLLRQIPLQCSHAWHVQDTLKVRPRTNMNIPYWMSENPSSVCLDAQAEAWRCMVWAMRSTTPLIASLCKPQPGPWSVGFVAPNLMLATSLEVSLPPRPNLHVYLGSSAQFNMHHWLVL